MTNKYWMFNVLVIMLIFISFFSGIDNSFGYTFQTTRIAIVSNAATYGSPRIGGQLFIITTVQNLSPQPMNFSYITEVFNAQGSVVSLKWFKDYLKSMEKRDLSSNWIPGMPGNYTAASFVWKDITNSEIPLSNSLNVHIQVRQ